MSGECIVTEPRSKYVPLKRLLGQISIGISSVLYKLILFSLFTLVAPICEMKKESIVKQFKKSLVLMKITGLTYAELQSVFKKAACVIDSGPMSVRCGFRQSDSDPDFLEILTPKTKMLSCSGIDVAARDCSDRTDSSSRLAFNEQSKNSWWERWKLQIFVSLRPTKSLDWDRRSIKKVDLGGNKIAILCVHQISSSLKWCLSASVTERSQPFTKQCQSCIF